MQRKRAGRIKHTKDQYALWILLAPAFIYVAIFFLWPDVWSADRI